MNASLYGMKIEECRQPERSLLVAGEIPISAADLVCAEEKMLQHYQVPGLLPIRFEETDLVVRLRYLLGNKRSLPAAVNSSPFNLLKLYQFLYRLMTIVDEGKAYLLNEDRYVLDPEFIYADLNLSEPSLLYMPVKELPGKLPPKEALARTARWLLTVTQGSGRRDARVWEALESQDIGWEETRHRLRQAVDRELSNLNVAKEEPGPAPAIVPEKLPVYSAPSAAKTVHRHSREDTRPAQPALNGEGLKSFSKRNVVLSVFLLLLFWTVFAWHPSEGSLCVSAGLSLLAADAAFILMKRGKLSAAVSPVAETASPSSLPMEASEYYKRLSLQTTLLSQPADTVLLSPLELHRAETNVSYALETIGDNKISLPLPDGNFILGRDKTAASFLNQEPGVSRIHLELVKSGEGYIVKDLDSKNGTLLNGERMIPFQEYALQDGDCLHLANSEYYFRKISS